MMQSQCQRPGAVDNDRGPMQRQPAPVHDLTTPPHGYQHSYMELLRGRDEITQALNAMSKNCDEYRCEASRVAEELSHVKNDSLRTAVDADQYKKMKQVLEKKFSECQRVADIAIMQRKKVAEELEQTHVELKTTRAELHELQKQTSAVQSQSLDSQNDHSELLLATQNNQLQLSIKAQEIEDLYRRNVELQEMYTQALESHHALEAKYNEMVSRLHNSSLQLARRGLLGNEPSFITGSSFEYATLSALFVDSHKPFSVSNVIVGAECSSHRKLLDSFSLIGSATTASVGLGEQQDNQVGKEALHTDALVADVARRYQNMFGGPGEGQ